jgi:hypothetical protein
MRSHGIGREGPDRGVGEGVDLTGVSDHDAAIRQVMGAKKAGMVHLVAFVVKRELPWAVESLDLGELRHDTLMNGGETRPGLRGLGDFAQAFGDGFYETYSALRRGFEIAADREPSSFADG